MADFQLFEIYSAKDHDDPVVGKERSANFLRIKVFDFMNIRNVTCPSRNKG